MSETNQLSIKEAVIQELTRCKQDPIYFCKKYYMIQHPTRGRTKFNLYPFQEACLKIFLKNPFNIINKSRQLGISTLSSGYALWLMLFHTDKNVLCIATKTETAKNMVTKVKFGYDNLPSWMKIKTVENNKLSIRLSNGSQMKAVSAAGDSARSEAVSLLLIDEAAFIDNIEEVFISAQQTLATGGGCIAMSTPYGTGNWFHRTWVKAESKENNFVPIRLPWTVHPERDQKWRDKQDVELGPRAAAQECFSEDVIIYTKLGPKPIKDIKVGDIVLSHDGTYNKVIRTFNHDSNDIYEINTSLNHIKKYVTSNHPWLDKNNKWVDTKDTKGKWINVFPNVDYENKNKTIDLKNIIYSDSPRHFVKYDNNNIWITKKHKSPRKITFDYDLGLILGLYYAEGSTWKNVVCYSYNAKTERNTWVLDLEKKLNKIFNIEIFSHHVSKQWEGSGNMYIKSKLFTQFIKKSFDGEKYCQSKHISQWVYENASKECLRGILDGIMLGDGMMKKEYSSQIWLTSEKLIYDIVYINNILGIHNISIRQGQNVFPSGERGINYCVNLLSSKVDSEEKIYSKRIQEHNINECYEKNRFLFEEKPYIQLNIKKTNKTISVYNFEVENTHTYVTEYGVVHNCDCDFSTSGDTAIDPVFLNWYESQLLEPIERRGFDSNLWIWERPDYSRQYAVFADCARGDSKDYSAFHVFDIENNNQVAEYRGQIGTRDYGHFLVGIATEYNNALLVIENANIGWDVIQTAIERNYPNLYYSPRQDAAMVNVEMYLDKYESGQGMVPGFTMSQRTRPLCISKMISYINEKSVTINSKRTLDELRVFVWKNGKAQAQNGYNDDLVMSLSIGMFLRDTSLKYKQTGDQLTVKALESMGRSQNYIGPAVYNNSAVYNTPQNTWTMDDGHGNQMDLTWLI